MLFKLPSLREEVYSPSLHYDSITDWTTAFSYILTVLKLTLHITRIVQVIAFCSPDGLVISPKRLCE